ncbi:hypothetical protein HK101_005889, partial [Irineochytrium annulatum]
MSLTGLPRLFRRNSSKDRNAVPAAGLSPSDAPKAVEVVDTGLNAAPRNSTTKAPRRSIGSLKRSSSKTPKVPTVAPAEKAAEPESNVEATPAAKKPARVRAMTPSRLWRRSSSASKVEPVAAMDSTATNKEIRVDATDASDATDAPFLDSDADTLVRTASTASMSRTSRDSLSTDEGGSLTRGRPLTSARLFKRSIKRQPAPAELQIPKPTTRSATPSPPLPTATAAAAAVPAAPASATASSETLCSPCSPPPSPMTAVGDVVVGTRSRQPPPLVTPPSPARSTGSRGTGTSRSIADLDRLIMMTSRAAFDLSLIGGEDTRSLASSRSASLSGNSTLGSDAAEASPVVKCLTQTVVVVDRLEPRRPATIADLPVKILLRIIECQAAMCNHHPASISTSYLVCKGWRDALMSEVGDEICWGAVVRRHIDIDVSMPTTRVKGETWKDVVKIFNGWAGIQWLYPNKTSIRRARTVNRMPPLVDGLHRRQILSAVGPGVASDRDSVYYLTAHPLALATVDLVATSPDPEAVQQDLDGPAQSSCASEVSCDSFDNPMHHESPDPTRIMELPKQLATVLPSSRSSWVPLNTWMPSKNGAETH